jgi:hypothetical protein
MTTPWSVPKDWVGETVAILASGPSMNRACADYVKGKCRVIAVNNQGIDTVVDGVVVPAIAPWADMLYASDAKWWMEYKDRALKFAGEKVTLGEIVPFPEVLSLKLSIRVPFDAREDSVVAGGNSGYAALHVAAQRGASRILLCGYDMREVNGARHWFGKHEGRLETSQKYNNWILNFTRLAPVLSNMGIEVLNCTPKSALKAFKNVGLETVI